ncbi:MAG: Ig-like domain-containing protein [Bacteroidales bacterium]|nr:Ig-like domain-containing protein [Bacteroidales bacterium]
MHYLNLLQYIRYRLLFAGLLILAACANPVSPSGGPKDTTPPSVIKSEPANQSVNFHSDKVVLTFNEFVSLKEITTQLVVSPPLSEQPEFVTRGKNLIMKLQEPLRDNTTYNFFFANSIVDLTESNPLAGYQFTFSTGPVLDSLTLSGKLMNAFTNQPVKGAFVMLFDSVYDSVPYKTRPYYLARSGETGEFNLNNLRDGRYLMFALTDINSDYIYNLPNEEIAFYDTLVRPLIAVKKPKEADSTAHDSLKITINQSVTNTLRHFRETDSVQKLSKVSLARENVLSVVFRFPVSKPIFTPLQPALSGDWNTIGYNRTRDTLTLWIPSPGSDSLKMIVADSGFTNDTIELSLKPREISIGRGKSKEKENTPSLVMKHNLISSKTRPDKPVVLTFSEPVISHDFNRVILKTDSTLLKPDLVFDDSIKTKLLIKYPWKEGINYQLTIYDSAFYGAFSHYNDSTGIKVSAYTEAETSYLKILTTLPEQGNNYVIQLLGDKEKVLEQQVISENTTLDFRYLRPGKYRIKVIYDENRNGLWDTGNYLKKRQPEYVNYHPKEFELRANWTLEEDWTIPAPGNK